MKKKKSLRAAVVASCLIPTFTGATIVETGDIFVTPLGQYNVGNIGVGETTISGGSVFNQNGSIFVANAGGSTGTLNVIGAGSQLNQVDPATQALLIGNGFITSGFGTPGAPTVGTVNIRDGASANVGDAVLGVFNGDARGTLNLSGSGSALNTRNLGVGLAGQGQYTQSGGTLNSNFAAAGQEVGATGQLDISGGTFNTNNSIAIGLRGTGTLNQSGGTVNSTFTQLGDAVGANGRMNISAGNFNVSESLDVGRLGSGVLDISGGTVTSTFFNVGTQSSADGRVEMSGGALDLSGAFSVGFHGTGAMRLSDGVVASDHATVGNEAGSNGQLDMSGGAVNLSGGIAVGRVGTGAMTMSGGTVNSGYAFVGAEAGSDGRLDMSGGTLNGNVAVGLEGTGTFNFTGGEVNTPFFTVGRLGDGTATLSGPGTVMNVTGTPTNSGFLNVSRNGGSTGTLNLDDGAQLNITEQAGASGGGFQLSRNTGTDATVNISNGASLNVDVTAPFVQIGRRSEGTMTVESGGSVRVNALNGIDFETSVGRQDAGNGTLNLRTGGNFTLTGEGGARGNLVLGRDVGTQGHANIESGGSLSVNGNVEVGRGGTGTLNLNRLTGGSLTAQELRVGAGGTLTTIDDAGAPTGGINAPRVEVDGGTWNMAFTQNVGSGITTLNVTNGGKLHGGLFEVARNAGEVTSATLDGTSTELNVDSVNVGVSGDGTMTVQNGATVDARFVNVGRVGGSTSVMTLDGANMNLQGNGTFGGFFTVGRSGHGTLDITNGSVIELNSAAGGLQPGFQIARNIGSEGHVTIDGGSTLNITGENPFVHVGRRNVGTLTIDDATININGTNGVAYETTIGRQDNGAGVATVRNGGQLNYNGAATLVLGRNAGTSGQLNIESGGSVRVAGNVDVASSGTGIVSIDAGAELNATRVNVNAGGTLNGSGQVAANLSLQGGSINPGSSPGTMFVDGDFDMSAGLLTIEIGGAAFGLFDMLDINGFADLTGGDILFNFVDGFDGFAGASFDFLLAGQGITNFENVGVTATGLNHLLAFNVVNGNDRLTLTLHEAPEPGTVGLMLMAALPVVALRRRKR